MKANLFIVLFVSTSLTLLGQQQNFSIRADSAGVIRQSVRAQYDSLYTNSANLAARDSIGSAFVSNFCPALRDRLQAAAFSWRDTTYIWINLFCSPTGKVEHAVYLSKQLPYDGQGAVFQKVIDDFLRDYTLGVAAERGYSQCGTLRFPHR